MNTAFLGNFIWQLKMLTVVVGAVDLGLACSRHVYAWDGEKSEFFLAMVIVCFMISLIWIFFAFIDSLTENEVLSKVDFVYHAASGILLLVGGICWFVSTSKQSKNPCKGCYIQMIMAGVFGFINGFLYLFVAFKLFRAGSPAN